MEYFVVEKKLLSVVIATLGGGSLEKTIEHLNAGTIIPFEILICIPEEDSERVNSFCFDNVRVIKTACRGQVSQRSIGFQSSTGKFVLQLDDDMFVEKRCLENLINIISSDQEKVAVAPALLYLPNNKSFYQRPTNNFFLKLYYWLLNGKKGYQPGVITLAGTNIGVDPNYVKENIIDVEWVPGGCLLHSRSNVIAEDFYPFKGKAYSEDLYHSFFLKQNKVKLKVCTLAQCFLDDDLVVYDFSFCEFFCFINADIKARGHLIKLSKKSIIRMYIYYIVVLLRYFSIQIKKWVGN